MPTGSRRICLLTYRGKPSCGGQGIYIRHLGRELRALGHEVEVWSGQPYPVLDDGVTLRQVPSLDLWNEQHFFRLPTLRELRDPIHVSEWVRTMTGAFPEPRTFTQRAARLFRRLPPAKRFDVVHDNQSLGPGVIDIQSHTPVVATIHHPITVDRRISFRTIRSLKKRIGLWRWYSFIPMQIRVARQIAHLTTVSQSSAADIARDFGIERSRLRVIEVGVDVDLFRPQPQVQRRPDRLITTISSSSPLKGLYVLLEAFAALRRERPSLQLTVIGSNGHPETERRLRQLDLNGSVRFTGWVTSEEIATTYAESTLAVVASLYEGFGLPAAEAMACGVPVVSTRAGALPEVIGTSGEAGVLVEAGEPASLVRPIRELLDQPERRVAMGVAGRARVESLFTWRRTAERTAELYEEAIAARRGRPC
jgi:glycosyltransferase involved in cell wall biosynthesis